MARPLPARARALAAASLTGALLFGGAGVAAAHVTVSSPGTTQGGYGVLDFRVPNESADAGTTELTVTLPGLRSASTEPVPGWTASVDKDPDSDLATSVTWTADPGVQIAPGQFMQFALLAGPLPDSGAVSFPAEQTYSDGTVVRWDQKADGSGTEPEHPAPSLTLAPAEGSGVSAGNATGTGSAAADSGASADSDASTDDSTARWLGGIALALGALALALALGGTLARRRS